MGRKSNDVETRKRKTKKDKARRKKELFGKYRPTREGDVISQKKKKTFSKSHKTRKSLRTFQKVHKNQIKIKSRKQKTPSLFFYFNM